MHSIGEGAVNYALDCYEAAYKVNTNIDARNKLTHLTYVTKDMPKRIADNKVIAVVNPTWSTWKYGTKEDEIKVYGEAEAKNMYIIKSFIDAGAVMGFHTDSAGITLEQIFCAITRNPAFLLKEENNLGSIEVGKSDDFTIYSVDLTDEQVVEDISFTDATLVLSISDGRMVFPVNLF